MKLRIGITDDRWFDFLRRQSTLDEVNFWQPSGRRRFSALEIGEPFLFKLHSPLNFIVGGGFYSHFSVIPCSLAWEAFGVKNGAATFAEMRERIEKYRRTPPDPREDYSIGCIILAAPFFFNEEDWIPIPWDFSKNIQQGKNYELARNPGAGLWQAVLQRSPADVRRHISGEVGWTEVTSRRRMGQGAFQVYVTDAYGRRCSVTGEKALPVLEAAHIRPVTCGGRHDVRNGLLLRRDLHVLFDRGYVTVGRDRTIRVSPKLRKEFDDGEYYSTFQKKEISTPMTPTDRPDPQLLEWHADMIFKG